MLLACVRQSIATPSADDNTEAANTAILATAKSPASGNACPAMKSDMVKPMPAKVPAPDEVAAHAIDPGLAKTSAPHPRYIVVFDAVKEIYRIA